MKLAVMQPYFFPYIGYFQLMNAVDSFIIYDDVAYIKNGWINRNRVLINGQASYITIPIIRQSSHKLINETLVQQDERWRIKLIKTLKSAYKKAPLFHEVYPGIENILHSDFKTVAEIATSSIAFVKEYLELNTSIRHSSSTYGNNHLKATERVLDFCKQEKATHYINAANGKSLYDHNVFDQNGIKLSFINSKQIKYKQFGNDYVPWLSIIDILMFNGIKEIRSMLSKFELE